MNKAIIFIMVLLSGLFYSSKAQNFLIFKDSITVNNLQKHLESLCDKKNGGREFATQGELNAAYYIRDQFINSGLTGNANAIDNYFQNYTLSFDTLISFSIENQKKTLSYLSDFFSWEFCFLHDTSKVGIIYAGFGLDGENYSDYNNIDVKDKWVVVEINSPFASSDNLIDNFDFDKRIDYSQINLKKEIAQENGAAGVIFKINSEKYPDFLRSNANNWYYYRSKDLAAINRLIGTYPVIFARHSAIDSLMGVNSNDFNEQINSSLKKGISPAGIASSSVSFKIDKQKRDFKSQNVVGIIKGKKENVATIITAHYDAVKFNNTLFYPGANDNASGTAALIQLADIFSKIVKSGYIPEKSIAFVAFSGEEEGLVGSDYFVKHKSILIDSNTININIDCIGILDSVNQDNVGYMYIYEADKEIDRMRTEFIKLASEEKQSFNIIFDPNFNSSDNASFAYDGIHALQILTGWGPMHSPQDSPEIINYNNLVSVTRFVFDVILSYNQFSTYGQAYLDR